MALATKACSQATTSRAVIRSSFAEARFSQLDAALVKRPRVIGDVGGAKIVAKDCQSLHIAKRPRNGVYPRRASSVNRLLVLLVPLFSNRQNGRLQAGPFLLADEKSSEIVATVTMPLQMRCFCSFPRGLFGSGSHHGENRERDRKKSTHEFYTSRKCLVINKEGWLSPV